MKVRGSPTIGNQLNRRDQPPHLANLSSAFSIDTGESLSLLMR